MGATASQFSTANKLVDKIKYFARVGMVTPGYGTMTPTAGTIVILICSRMYIYGTYEWMARHQRITKYR